MRTARIALLVACTTVSGCDGLLGMVNPSICLVAQNLTAALSAGETQTVRTGDVVYLGGALVGDLRCLDDSPPLFEWSQVEGPSVLLSRPDLLSGASFTAPAAASDTTMRFQLRVITEQGGERREAIKSVVINVLGAGAGKTPPVADAGVPRVWDSGAPVTIDAGASIDTEGAALLFSWTQIEGPVVQMERADEAAARFTAPDVTEEIRLAFRVLVTDSTGLTDTDEVVVTIVPS